MDRGVWRATVHAVAELDMTEQLTPTCEIAKQATIAIIYDNIIIYSNISLYSDNIIIAIMLT